MNRFEPYAVPTTGIASAYRGVDEAITEVVALRRENVRLRQDKAHALACAEVERSESARLRRENHALANELETTVRSASMSHVVAFLIFCAAWCAGYATVAFVTGWDADFLISALLAATLLLCVLALDQVERARDRWIARRRRRESQLS